MKASAPLGAGLFQIVRIAPRTPYELHIEALEGLLAIFVDLEDGDVVRVVEGAGDLTAYLAAAHDQDIHQRDYSADRG